MANREDDNLHAIKSIDPFTEAIISKVSHAALFEFDTEKNQWNKTEIEGPLFVYRRLDVPLHSLIIASRQSTSNFIEPITKQLNISYKSPYIFLHQTDGTIKGLWASGEDECKRLYELLTLLIRSIDGPLIYEGSAMHLSNTNKDIRISQKYASRSDSPPSTSHSSTKAIKSKNIAPSLHSRRSVKTEAKISDLSDQIHMNTDVDFGLNPPASLSFNESSEVRVTSSIVAMKLDDPKRLSGAISTEITGAVDASYNKGISMIQGCCTSVKNLKNSEFSRREASHKTDADRNREIRADNNNQTVGLSSNQILQALDYLLHNDETFINKIHQAYTDSLISRLKNKPE